MSVARHAVLYFEEQFQRQVDAGDYALNPFEVLALPHVRSEVLDLGCGLGNLAIAVARRGCEVTAVDGSTTAVERLDTVVRAERLPMSVRLLDLVNFDIETDYDTIVCIGLLMFLPPRDADRLLRQIVHHVRPGGVAVVNVLTTGTTFRAMFGRGEATLFEPGQVAAAFSGWELAEHRQSQSNAPGGKVKCFETIVAIRPRRSARSAARTG